MKRFGKNKFKGNQFSAGKHKASSVSVTSEPNNSESEISDIDEPRPRLVESRPITADENSVVNDEINISASEKKLQYVNSCGKKSDYLPENNIFGNFIIDLEILNQTLLSSVKCVDCDSPQSIEIIEKPSERQGLACLFVLSCKSCGYEKSFYTSRKSQNTNFYDINLRCVYGFRSIGKGKAAADVLCAVMDLPQPPTRFQNYTNVISKATEEVAENTMLIATRAAVIENDGDKDIAACFDGTWQKRGHTSLNGVFTVTSMDTGKVLDAVCLSKYCTCINKSKHQESCTKNYEGSSGAMEVTAAREVFARSISRGVRYVKYLGDGDSNAFQAVVDSKPYDNVDITKLECVGHVQKRMGSRLRRLKTKWRGKKLSDGKPLSGKGRLTDAVIDSLQVYFGKAIRGNTDDVNKMKKATWATYYHKLSTDAKPQHRLCPDGEDSWCGYKRAAITGEEYTHKNSIPKAVMEVVKPIYTDLTDGSLLKKCVHGRTQNCNEALNNVIWTRIPKNNFVSLHTLKVGVWDAIITYNVGALGKVQVLEKLCKAAGRNCVIGLQKIDRRRILEARKANKEENKIKRRQKRNMKRKKEDKDKEKCVSYGAGDF